MKKILIFITLAILIVVSCYIIFRNPKDVKEENKIMTNIKSIAISYSDGIKTNGVCNYYNKSALITNVEMLFTFEQAIKDRVLLQENLDIPECRTSVIVTYKTGLIEKITIVSPEYLTVETNSRTNYTINKKVSIVSIVENLYKVTERI